MTEQDEKQRSTTEVNAVSEALPPAEPPAAAEDGDYSLPLSARREAPAGDAADEDDYSLPLSARRETGWRQTYQREPEPAAVYTPPTAPPAEYREVPDDQGFTVRALVEGAMMVALTVLFGLISLYVPFFGIVGQLLYPLPMAVLVLRRGLKVGIVGTVAQFVLSIVIFGIAQASIMLVEFGMLGLFLGYCFRVKKKPLFTLGFATMIAAAGMVIGLLLSAFASGLPVMALFSELQKMIELTYTQMAEMAEAQGMAATMLQGLSAEEFVRQMMEMANRLIPAMLIISVMFMTMLNYIVSAKVLRRLRYDIPQLPKFALWRMDWRVAWGVIVGLALEFAGKQFSVSWLETLGSNVLWIFCPVLFVCGVSFVVWYVKNSGMNLAVKVIIIVMLLQFFSFALYFVMLLGVVEAIYDLRGRVSRSAARRQKKRADEEAEKEKNDRIMR